MSDERQETEDGGRRTRGRTLREEIERDWRAGVRGKKGKKERRAERETEK
jgi:hypothetical protein